MLRSIRSVQQGPDAQGRGLAAKGVVVSAQEPTGRDSINDAWGVKTEAAPAVEKAKIVQRFSW